MILDAVADWQELSALYEEADALDEAGRARWLARLRAQQHRLLPRVERMLAARAHIGSHDFLEALPVLDTGDEPAPSGWSEGSRIGAYRLARHLGSGGMAEVWLADRVDGAFERQVAIKLLFDHPSRAQRETFVERFRRERNILASLDHPNIARLHDAGVTPSGQPWLALEYIEGESITAWCDQRSVDLGGRVRIFRQVLLAVQHAHANLVLHRDLKPANILVTREGQVRLLDFGIAKLLEAEGHALDDTALTRQAGRLLTLQYASPEQLQGQPLTTACDIYSLGVVLYELLCGERPYQLARMSAASLEHAVLNIDPKRPGSRPVSAEIAAQRASTPARVKKALAGDLAAIALHAMAKRPADRYRSAESFCADLDRWLEGRPVEATSPTAWVRSVRFVARHRVATSLTSTAVLAIVVTAGLAVYQGLRAQEQATRALAAREFVFDLFKSADPNAAKDGPMSVRTVLATGVRRSGERFAGDPSLRAEILQQIGQVQARLGEKTDAQTTLSVAVELLRHQHAGRRWAEVQIELADLHGRLGTTATGYQLLREIEPVVERDGADNGLVSRFHEVRGWLYRDEQRLDEARSEMERALTQARLVDNDHGQRVIDVLRGLASVESAQNDSSAAIAHIDEAAAWADKSPEALLNDVIGIGFERARIRFAAGDYKVAGDLVSSYGPRCRQALGERSESCLLLLDQQVQVLLGVGDTAAAFALFPALRSAQEALSSPVRKAQFLVLAARAQAAGGATGVDDGVFPALRQLAESPQEVPLPSVFKLSANLVLAEAALRRGDVDAALRWLDGFAQRQTSWKVSIDTLRVRATVLRGIALAMRGEAPMSARTFQSAAADADAVFGTAHTLSLIYRLNVLRSAQMAARNQLLDSVLPSLRTRLGVSSPLVLRGEAMRASMGSVGSGQTSPEFSDFFL